MVDEFLEAGIHHLTGIGRPHELVGGVEDEGELVHLGLVEGVGYGIDVGGIDPHMAGAAAQPLPSVFSAHVLALRHRLWRRLLLHPRLLLLLRWNACLALCWLLILLLFQLLLLLLLLGLDGAWPTPSSHLPLCRPAMDGETSRSKKGCGGSHGQLVCPVARSLRTSCSFLLLCVPVCGRKAPSLKPHKAHTYLLWIRFY